MHLRGGVVEEDIRGRNVAAYSEFLLALEQHAASTMNYWPVKKVSHPCMLLSPRA